MKHFSIYRICFSFILMILCHQDLISQLDSIHWMAPLTGWLSYNYEQLVYISTPSDEPFEVAIRNGSRELLETITISNANPYVYKGLSYYSTHNDEIMIQSDYHTVLENRGLIFEGEKKFYVNYRAKEGRGSQNSVTNLVHGGSLTTKGRSALGLNFRIGHFFSSKRRGTLNFFALMTTEDNTKVVISDFNNGIKPFYADGNLNAPFDLVFPKAGMSYVLAIESHEEISRNALMGALISANKPITVNCGSWVNSPSEESKADIGIDQILPIESLGKEYVLVKGAGSDLLETPIVVAHYENTEIYINGNAQPETVIEPGDFFVIPSDFYSSNENMYIRSNKNIYVYQSLGGTKESQTGGMNFVPPMSCSDKAEVNLISEINKIGDTEFEGGVFIVGLKDASVILNGGSISPGQPKSIPGIDQYVTYKVLGISGNLSVSSDGPIQVGYFGYNTDAGWTSFFSGFPEKLPARIDLTKKNGCPDTLIAKTSHHGEITWYRNEQLLSSGMDTILITKQSGSYHASLTTGSNCGAPITVISKPMTIVTNQPPTINNIESVESHCNQTLGEITVFASGGTGALEYSIDGSPFQLQNIFLQLTAGPHLLNVKDEYGCTTKTEYDLGGTLPPKISSYEVTNTTCGLPNGAISLIVTEGSNSGLKYSLTAGMYQDQPTFENLVAGNYLVQVKDAGNCEAFVNLEVVSSESPKITNTIATQTSCAKNNGGIEIQITPGSELAVEYAITGFPFQQDNTFTGLPPGEYAILIRDKFECTDSSLATIQSSSLPIIDRIEVIPASCDLPNGIVRVESKGGKGTLEYSVNGHPYQYSNTFESLSAADYEVLVKDEDGCTASRAFEITGTMPPAVERVEISNTTCGLPNGEVMIRANLGSSPDLLFRIQGRSFQRNPHFDSLSAGTYVFTIQDGAGCRSSSIFDVKESFPPEIRDVETKHTTCGINNGAFEINAKQGTGQTIEFSITGFPMQESNTFLALRPGAYQVLIRDELGCTDSIYTTIEESLPPTIEDAIVTHTRCNQHNGAVEVIPGHGTGSYLQFGVDDLAFDTSTFWSNLQAGQHLIRIEDEFGCSDSTLIQIQQSREPSIEEILITPATCGGNAKIEVNSKNGDGNQLFYSLDSAVFQTSNIFANLPPGIHHVYLNDELGCGHSTQVEVHRINPPKISVRKPIQMAKCQKPFSGAVELEATHGRGPYKFKLDERPWQEHKRIDSISTGVHQVYVIDRDGCTDRMPIKIEEICFELPNVFYPGSQQVNNQEFGPIFTNPEVEFKEFLFQVYNRWGNEVFSSTNMATKWNGRCQDQKEYCNQDVYVWQIRYQLKGEQEEKQRSGDVFLLKTK